MLLMKRTFQPIPAKIAGVVLLGIVVVAVFANWIAPVNPYTQDVSHILASPSWHHLLGTDNLGRDTLSRLIVGARISLVGALEAVTIGFLLGVIPGMLSVFLRRWPQFLAMRVVDSFMTLPAIVFTIGCVAVFGETQQIAMAAIGVLFAPGFFRVVRASTLNFAKSQYVEVAGLLGATRRRIIRTHIWRKVLPTIAVQVASTMAGGILAVSSLAYLGVGSQPPTPTWGGMLASDMNYLANAGYAAIFPGIAIVLTVASLGIIADCLRDATRSGADAVSGAATSVDSRQAPATTQPILETVSVA
jgi:peptide/nickel transport system permease protein